MESNELKKSTPSQKVDLLTNDVVTPLEDTPLKKDTARKGSVKEKKAADKLSESVIDTVKKDVKAKSTTKVAKSKKVDEVPAVKAALKSKTSKISSAAEEKAKVKAVKPSAVKKVKESSELPIVKVTSNAKRSIPIPVQEVSGTAETTLIDQIVQVTDDTEEDDDLFSEHEPDGHAIPIHDYSSYSKIQLVNTLRKILSEGTAEEIRPHAEAIKGCFYKIRNSDIQEQKLAFTSEGNEEELFEPQDDPFEAELKDLLREYKNLRAELNKKQDALKEENYHRKLAIIDEIKSLINSEESINMTFQEFNNLQDKWKGIGQVPQTKVKDLWENYHYNVELFYDFVKINRELRDLDLRRNMDEKSKLCLKAEELAVAAEAEALSTFRELQKLHESWREIGPVPRENKQELWERFKSATTVINKRYQHFFEQERSTQKEQLQKKVELCELAEQYCEFTSENPREWNDVTEKVITLQESWKNSGFGPRKENAKVWERFRAANDAFFQNKRNFWNKSKDQLNKNLALKLDICDQAEKLKETDDWKATTDKLIGLQKRWKEVGPVPRKQSELIWKRFRSACDEFFSRKTTHFSGVTGDQDDNYKAKKALIEEIEAFKATGNAKEDIDSLKKFQDRWSEIGFVPFRKKEELQARYHGLIDGFFDQLKLDDQDMGLYKFKSKIEHLASQRGWSKINMERDRCAQHLKQLENDINTLANNVGFFGSSKGAQALIDGVNIQIDKIKVQIDYLKEKIKIIDSQEEIN